MNISRYQKIFGVGPLGLVIGLSLLAALWLLDKQLGHVQILAHPHPIRAFGLLLACLDLLAHLVHSDHPAMVAAQPALYERPVPVGEVGFSGISDV
jgi:hypothetical protein